jgi:outer membrane protein, heavy metal efflux system
VARLAFKAFLVAGALAVFTAWGRCDEPLDFVPSLAVELTKPPEPVPLPPVDDSPAQNQLTLAEAEAMATAFHPALREAAGRVRAAAGNWLQVGLRRNPAIGYIGEDIGDAGTAGKQGGFISQEIVTAGKLGLNRAVAMHEQAAAEQRYQLARLQVLTTVRTYYIESLSAERAVALARQLRDIAGQSVRVSEQRLKAQEVPKSSLLQSQIESESSALLEQQANERHEAARKRLATAIGQNDVAPMTLEDVMARPLPDLTWQSTRDRVLAESPELSELRFEVERAKWAVQRATAGRVPNMNAQAGVEYDNAARDTVANVQLSMPLPLFDRNQGAISQACGELTAAHAALESKQLELEQRLAIAMRDYLTARERVTKYAEKVLPAARESLDIVNTGYQQGELDYLQVLTVQQTYAEKNLVYLQDLETAWKKWVQIDALLVGPLPSSSD